MRNAEIKHGVKYKFLWILLPLDILNFSLIELSILFDVVVETLGCSLQIWLLEDWDEP